MVEFTTKHIAKYRLKSNPNYIFSTDDICFNLNTNDNMKKIFEKLRQGKQWLISFVMVRTFLLSSRKRQNYLIMKNASMFLGLQNLAKKYDNDGDTRTAMLISSESYDYLGNFTLYCNAKGLDQVKWLKMYAP